MRSVRGRIALLLASLPATSAIGQPTVISVSPASGTGYTQTLASTYSESPSYTSMTQALFLVQTSINGASACYLMYELQNNGLYLTNDAATAWQGPITPGTSATLQNSQCTLTGSASAASGSGATLTVNFGLTFTSAFSGTKNTYMYVSDTYGANSGWQTVGSWVVGAGSQPPTAVSVSLVRNRLEPDLHHDIQRFFRLFSHFGRTVPGAIQPYWCFSVLPDVRAANQRPLSDKRCSHRMAGAGHTR